MQTNKVNLNSGGGSALAGTVPANTTFSERNPAKWSRIVNQIVCNVDIVAGGTSGFFGEMCARNLDALNLLTINCDRESARRDRRHIAADPDETALLMFVETGELRISQLNRELVVGPNTAVLYDLTVPYTYYHSDRTRLLAAKVPISALSARLGRHRHYLGRTYHGLSGSAAITSRYLASLMEHIGDISPSIAPDYAAKSFDLIALMLESSDGCSSISQSQTLSALFRRSVAVIDADLAEADLDPTAIARRVGVSTRYLHKIFQEAGTSVTGHLRERRLLKAHEDLVSDVRHKLPIAEIARRSGFGSSAHFSRAFRKRFGYSASHVRGERRAKELATRLLPLGG